MNIDQNDVAVQKHFTAMKKESNESNRILIAEDLAKMYEKNDNDYSYGVFLLLL